MLGDVIYSQSIEFLHRVCLNPEFDSRLVEMVKVVGISLLGSGIGRNSISYKDIYFILAYPSHVQIEFLSCHGKWENNNSSHIC